MEEVSINLDILVQYNWRKLLNKILEVGLHPFDICKEELQLLT